MSFNYNYILSSVGTQLKNEDDKLIQLCDSMAAAEGVVDMEDRMNDVKRRYGSYPQSKWDKNMELKDYFEQRVCRNIYEIVGKD